MTDDGDDAPVGASGELWIHPPARELVTLGYLDRPEITATAIVDRMRDTIRRMGENISSVALEAVVLAVVGHPDAPPIDPAALHERLRGVLPRYMVPALIVVSDQLPTTPTGKIRKIGLADDLDLSSAWRAPERS